MTQDQTQTTDAPFETDHQQFDTDRAPIDVEKAQQGLRLLLEAVGEDPDRGALVETWQRRGPELAATLSEGYRDEAKPTMKTFPAETDDLVVKTGIPLYSLCQHHLLPYTGTVHVAYRPEGAVVGLSKLARYVCWRSRRLTVQEQLTRDIAEGLASEIGTDIVLVEAEATHFCEAMRGVETETTTVTTATVGSPTETERTRFRDAIARTTPHQ
jgi:GTP cyclohydrolase I